MTACVNIDILILVLNHLHILERNFCLFYIFDMNFFIKYLAREYILHIENETIQYLFDIIVQINYFIVYIMFLIWRAPRGGVMLCQLRSSFFWPKCCSLFAIYFGNFKCLKRNYSLQFLVIFSLIFLILYYSPFILLYKHGLTLYTVK